MKKYFLIWLVAGFLSEAVFYYKDHLLAAGHDQGFYLFVAVITNPYSLLYMGCEGNDQCLGMFIIIHTLRFVWLFVAAISEYLSSRFNFLYYVSQGMLVLYFVPSLLALYWFR